MTMSMELQNVTHFSFGRPFKTKLVLPPRLPHPLRRASGRPEARGGLQEGKDHQRPKKEERRRQERRATAGPRTRQGSRTRAWSRPRRSRRAPRRPRPEILSLLPVRPMLVLCLGFLFKI